MTLTAPPLATRATGEPHSPVERAGLERVDDGRLGAEQVGAEQVGAERVGAERVSAERSTSPYIEAVRALAANSPSALSASQLTDDDLLATTRTAAEALRHAQHTVAVLAAEVARRSAPELGQRGLAQRSGHRTPEVLVRAATGSTIREAAVAVRIGSIMRENDNIADATTGVIPDSTCPWLAPVGHAVATGTVSVAAAEAIRAGLGSPADGVTVEALTGAAAVLALEATRLDPDRLLRRARELRDDLDTAGVIERERQQRAARSLRHWTSADGMGHVNWTMDPETAALFRDLYDRATSPRRGGPRFVSGPSAERADEISRDDRTTEQIASDTFLHLLVHGADTNSSELLGSGAPVIRIIVTADDLRAGNLATDHLTTDSLTSDSLASDNLTAGEGYGVIDGSSDAVSLGTVNKHLCNGTSVPITVDSTGQVLDLGREQRLHSRRQRIAIAARDGGCLWTDCDRPASWCEVHHIKHWHRDHGRTDIADGILLCTSHHLLAHDQGWEFSRDGGRYFLIPPASIDTEQKPVPLPSKSRAMLRALATRAATISARG